MRWGSKRFARKAKWMKWMQRVVITVQQPRAAKVPHRFRPCTLSASMVFAQLLSVFAVSLCCLKVQGVIRRYARALRVAEGSGKPFMPPSSQQQGSAKVLNGTKRYPIHPNVKVQDPQGRRLIDPGAAGRVAGSGMKQLYRKGAASRVSRTLGDKRTKKEEENKHELHKLCCCSWEG